MPNKKRKPKRPTVPGPTRPAGVPGAVTSDRPTRAAAPGIATRDAPKVAVPPAEPGGPNRPARKEEARRQREALRRKQARRRYYRIGVIAEGRLVAEGTLAELRQQNGHHSLEDLFIALVGAETAAA